MYRESLRSKWREVEKVYVREDQEYSNNVFMKKFCTELGLNNTPDLINDIFVRKVCTELELNITSDLINDFCKAMGNILKSGNQGEEDIYRIFIDTIDSFADSMVDIEDYLTIILKALDRVSTNKWEIRNSHEYAVSYLLVKALCELVIYEPNVKQMKPCTSYLLTCGIKRDKVIAELEKLARLIDERDDELYSDVLRSLIVIAVHNCVSANARTMLSNCITFMRLLNIPTENIQEQVAKYGLAMSIAGYLEPEESNRIEDDEGSGYRSTMGDTVLSIEDMIKQSSNMDLSVEITNLDLRIYEFDKTYLKKELRSILSGCAREGLTFS